MKIIEVLKQEKPTISFEFFPPKTKEQEEKLFKVVAELKKFNPDFVSVTYGALGNMRSKTFFWAKEIKDKFNIEPLAHLTCVAGTKQDILEQLKEIEKIGVENILALRGDPPQGDNSFKHPKDGFGFARDLIVFIKQNKPGFCLGAAGYPEGHPETKDLKKDIQHLKEKINAGVEYIITQLFFDNDHFFRFLERAQKIGISVPILPGLMPITSVKSLKKMTQMCGASIPKKLLSNLEKHENDPKGVVEIGIEQTLKQAQELLKQKVVGLHFFVMNQSGPISEILRFLSSRRKSGSKSS